MGQKLDLQGIEGDTQSEKSGQVELDGRYIDNTQADT